MLSLDYPITQAPNPKADAIQSFIWTCITRAKHDACQLAPGGKTRGEGGLAHRYSPVRETARREIRAVVETVWPELLSKLPPKL